MIRLVLTGLLLGLLTCVSAGAQRIKVELPSGFKSANQDPISESSVILSVSGDQFYGDGDRVEKNNLTSKLSEVIKRRNEPVKVVYIACQADSEYGRIVEVLSALRDAGVGQAGLIVNRGNPDNVALGAFLIEFPMPLKEGDDLSKFKPNPLMLVAAVLPDLQLELNHDKGLRRGGLCFGSAPKGFGSDPANLKFFLACLFDHRSKERAFRIGMETRNDVPLGQRIEKTVYVKAPRSAKYADVLRVIDAIKEAGANPIGLQLDDLSN